MWDIPAPGRYAVAVLLALCALGLRALLSRWLGGLQPLASGWVAIAASVWFLGWGPAVLAAVTSFVGGTYLFMSPGAAPAWSSPMEIAATATFGLSSGLIIAIGHRGRVAERRLADANAELRAADRRKDEFLATISHELRNPVSVITSAVAVLDSGPHDPRTRSTIEILSRQTAQIQRLVEDLIDVGRIARGQLTLQQADVDLRTCVEHAVEATRHHVTVKHQSIEVSAPSSSVQARADAARLVQVVSNLIDNASKYSQEAADIRVSLTDRGQLAAIEVSDNGPGIDPSVVPHLFDRFDRGGGAASGGLGLGLGLCKRLVEMHGGTITAGSNPSGRGTTFVITLPKGIPA